MVCGLVWLPEQTPKGHVLKRNAILKYDKRYKLNMGGGGAYMII
jgi:hypothetical protein